MPFQHPDNQYRGEMHMDRLVHGDLDQNSHNMISSQLSSSFIPVNLNGQLEFKPLGTQEQPSSSPRVSTDCFNDGTGIPAFTNDGRRTTLKRAASSGGDRGVHNRGFCLPATPSSSPFRTLKVTKYSVKTHKSSGFGTNHYIAQATMQDNCASPELSLQSTTMDCLTPYPSYQAGDGQTKANEDANRDFIPKNIQHPGGHLLDNYSTTSSINIVDASQRDIDLPHLPVTKGPHSGTEAHTTLDQAKAEGSDHPLLSSETLLEPATDDTGLPDDYPIDEFEEEDMIRLLEDTSAAVENHMPPASVQQGWDRDSRSADEYDPNLQFSSRSNSSEIETMVTSSEIPAAEKCEDDLLDEEVDWGTVYAITSSIPKDPSLVGSREGETTEPLPRAEAQPAEHLQQSIQPENSGPLSPFARPPFPERVRDRSSVPGMSSNTVLRTCFRIGEMISQSARCFNHQQEVVVELYARVTYSSRESLARKQHFQFVDLFKDRQPYPSGTLSGWRMNSLLDRQSQAFINIGGPKLCWCLCKPKRDTKAAVGWAFEVLGIRETDWAQIRFAKAIVYGALSEDMGTPAATAKL
ncbi:uncharacterized protein BCR38DRAFT_525511 [Pseudomassariella vexata]|uniref:Uncharacterized protein n=1 Tax=Pseudomassariella vexata TaxID=1141098 RepID=A0A1Y2DTE4_9PEZI|nr:uncharacterized protein BCR38DRAFT_525511 [Pseudomassariella vexata]ORY62543.1 hypothetical protein BCR38DRAFT_525511 [Pseudomassariella vexata]